MTINILLHQTVNFVTPVICYITPNHVWKTPYTSVKSALIESNIYIVTFFCSFSTGTPVSKKYIVTSWLTAACPWQCERGKRGRKLGKRPRNYGHAWTQGDAITVSSLSLSLSLSLFLCVAKGGVAAFESFMSDKEMGAEAMCIPAVHSNTDELNLWPLSVMGGKSENRSVSPPPHFHLLRAFLLIGCHHAAKLKASLVYNSMLKYV